MSLVKKIKDKKVNFEFNKEYIKVVNSKIANNDAQFITNSFKEMHPADAADIIEHLNQSDRESLIKLNNFKIDPEVFVELNESIQTEIITYLSSDSIVAILTNLESDDAISILENVRNNLFVLIKVIVNVYSKSMVSDPLSNSYTYSCNFFYLIVFLVPNSNIFFICKSIDLKKF